MLRFSTSSVDDMSLDELRVALLNYLVAKQRGEKFFVRIEGESAQIVELLSLFGIVPDEVSYQTHNLRFHQQLATKLLMDKKAFNCFCDSKDKDEKCAGGCQNLPDSAVIDNENPFSVRLKQPEDNSFDDFVILKVDKTPTYNFALGLDDMLGDVSFVIDSQNKILDTKKQAYIRELLGYDKSIEYVYLTNMDAEKRVKALLEDGYLPDAISEYLLGSEDKKEFQLDKAVKSSVKFDIKDLNSINRKHIKAMDSLKLATLVGFKSKDIGELAKTYAEELSTINQIKEKIDTIFSKKSCKDEKCQKLKDILKDAPHFEEFEKFESYLRDKSQLNSKEFLKTLSFIMTGIEENPNLSDIYPYIKNYIKEIAR